MDIGLATVLAAIILAVGGFLATKMSKVQESTANTEKSIKGISEGLPSLKLLFEHDSNGNRLQGSLENLIDATLKGYPIKLRIHHSEQEIEIIDAQSLYIEKNVVFASNTSLISTTRDNDGDHVYQDETYHYYLLAGSNGSFHQKRIFVDGTPRNTSKIKRHIAWIGLLPVK